MNREISNVLILMAMAALAALGQSSAPPPPTGPGGGGGWGHGGSRMDRGFRNGPPGQWWADAGVAQRLGLTVDQQKKIEDHFQQSRLKLIDLRAALQKEEATLDPLLAADRPEEARILLQIDRIAQARSELEKASARMLLGFRNVLTPEQWKKLQAEGPGRMPGMGYRRPSGEGSRPEPRR